MCVCVFHAFFSIEKLHVYGLYGMWNKHERSLPGDALFFHYSGHGGREVDANAQSGYVETLCPEVDLVAGVAGKWRLGRDGKMGMVSLWFLKQIQEELALMNTDEQMCSTFLGMEAGNFRRKNLRCHD